MDLAADQRSRSQTLNFCTFITLALKFAFQRWWHWLGVYMSLCSLALVPYFFGYKTEFFSFQNNPIDLDPSCKMDLDLWDCLGRVKLVL